MNNMWPTNIPKSSEFPTVSIVTPTYNRRKFIPWIIQCIQSQTYPAERMEWLIYDDGSDPILDILTPHISNMNIRYFSNELKLNIGAKRNKLHAEARGEIIVVMDDDDYYPPERVAYAVKRLKVSKVDIAGSTRNHLFFTDDKSIWEVGPYATNHATFGTMAFTKQYVQTHTCDESVTFAEEVQFTKKYSSPLVQLDPMKTMLVICHSQNTYNKDKIRKEPSPVVKKLTMKIQTFIKSKLQRDFYSNA